MKNASRLASRLVVAAATLALAGQALAGQQPPSSSTDYLVETLVKAQSGSCRPDTVGLRSFGRFTYPGPEQRGAELALSENTRTTFNVTVFSFPRTPRQGVKDWSGPYTSQVQPDGRVVRGTFTARFLLLDQNTAQVTIRLTQGQCTTTVNANAFALRPETNDRSHDGH
jgi:hypothetical protein